MSKTSRRTNLAEANRSAIAIASRLTHLERLLGDHANGSRSGGGAGPRNGVSDPVGNAATRDTRAKNDERQLDRHLAAAARNLLAAERIATYWTTDLPAKVEELVALERAADPGCEIVSEFLRADGTRYWEPIHRTTDLGGLLARPYALGSWAYDFARRNGRLPVKHETQVHVDGRRVMVKA